MKKQNKTLVEKQLACLYAIIENAFMQLPDELFLVDKLEVFEQLKKKLEGK